MGRDSPTYLVTSRSLFLLCKRELNKYGVIFRPILAVFYYQSSDFMTKQACAKAIKTKCFVTYS